jgi:hypothetical protein
MAWDMEPPSQGELDVMGPTWDAEPPSPTELKEKIMPIESTLRGAAQSATLGFADEAAGGVEALWELAKGDPNTFGELYKKHRDESRMKYKDAEKENPRAYLAGEIGGAIASTAIPLGAATSLGKSALVGARVGTINALGQSESEDGKELFKDVALGGVVGAAGGVAAKGIEKGFKAAKKLPGVFTQKAAQEISQSPGIAQPPIMMGGEQLAPDNPSLFKEAALSAKNRIKSYWKPEIDPTYKEFEAIAKKNGIDTNLLPEAVKFGPDSSASRAARNLAEGRFGEESLKRFNKGLDQVRGAYDKKILNYSKGLPVDEVTAGKVLRESYDEGVSKFFDQMDFTHNTIINQAPGLQLSPKAIQGLQSKLEGVEKFAKGRLQRGVTSTQKGQAQQLLSAVEAIRNSNGSYKQAVEALRDIGEAAFQSKNSLADVPVDVAKMRNIYSELNNGLIDTVRSNLGDDIANKLVGNNKAMSEFFSEKSLVAQIMGDKSIAPEKAFRSLVLSGDSQKLQALKKILPPEKWEYLKGAVLENLVKRDTEQNFTFKQLHSAMRSKKNSLTSIFEPEEIMESAGLVRLGDRFGNPVLSSSGTGASLSFQDIYKVPANLSVDALAVTNANRAAKKATSEVIEKPMRDVSPKLKDAVIRAGGMVGGAPEKSKGEEKWARDGFEKIINSTTDIAKIEKYKKIKEQLLKSPRSRKALVSISDLKPGSKAFDNAIKELEKEGGL